MIDDFESVSIEFCRQHFLSQRHTDRVCKALPQRSRGRLNAESWLVFGMPRRAVAKLTKVANLVNRKIVSGQVQQAVEQHRAMAVRQYEAVAVDPLWIGRIVFVVIVPQHFGNVGHAHRRTGVSRVGSLYGVHAECTNSVCEVPPGRLTGLRCFL